MSCDGGDDAEQGVEFLNERSDLVVNFYSNCFVWEHAGKAGRGIWANSLISAICSLAR